MSPNQAVHCAAVLIAIAVVVFCLTGCTIPRSYPPLSAFGPQVVGPVSCKLDPAGGTKPPRYWSDSAQYFAQPSSHGGAVAIADALWSVAEVKAVTVGGQSKMDAISKEVGLFERPLILSDFEKTLTAAGYNVQPNAQTTFTLVINFYGLWKKGNGMTQAYVQGFVILKDKSGETILSYGQALGASVVGRNLDDYSKNPELYRVDLGSAAENFAKLVVADRTQKQQQGQNHFENELGD